MTTKTILIFADANRRASITAARQLKKQGCRLLFAISNDFPERLTHMLFRHFSTSPLLKYDAKDLTSFLNNLEKQVGPYEILPVGEWHIREILSNKTTLNENIKLCINNLEAYNKLSNKLSFIELCKSVELNHPKDFTQLPDAFDSKFVVKPKEFVKHVRVLNAPLLVDSKGLFDDLLQMPLDWDRHFYQQFIEGPSVYYCAYYKNGDVTTQFSQFNSIQQPNGKSVIKAHPIDLPKSLTDKIDLIFQNLNWNGPMMFELKQCNSSQTYSAIECNPRLWGPLQITMDNGYDFVSPCFDLPVTKPNKPAKPIGYLWKAGYIQGYLFKKQTQQNFQIFKDPEANKITYKDVFLRKDSLKYYITELIYQCKELMKFQAQN